MGALATYRAAFRGLPRGVWLAALVAFLNRAGTMVLPFLGLWLAEQRGIPKVTTGILLAVWGVGSILGTWTGGWLADRLGAQWVLARSLVATAAGFLLLPTLESIPAIAVGLFLVAAAGDAFRPAIMAYVAVAAPPGEATRAVTLLRLFINAGMSFGPALGGLLAAFDYLWIFRVDALTCLLAAAVTVRWLPPLQRVARDGEAGSGLSPWRDRPALALLGLSFLFALVLFQIVGAWPLYLSLEVGLSEPQIGLLLGVNAALVMVFEMAVVTMVAPLRQLRVSGWGALFGCLGFGATGLATGFGPALASVLLWSFAEMLTLPITSGLVMNRAPAGRAGEWMGAFAMNWSVAMLLAPVLGTAVWTYVGPQALWLAVAALGPVLWLLHHWLDRHWDAPSRATIGTSNGSESGTPASP